MGTVADEQSLQRVGSERRPRLRDVLPGRYTFGLTGRDPNGQLLAPGTYSVRVVAYPVDIGPPSRRKLTFTIR